MPKQRITREMVLHTAFVLLRRGGDEAVLVKEIAGELGCSVQPIYSCFKSMEGLRAALTQATDAFMREYVRQRVDLYKGDFFASTGRAYIGFAREEPHLFKSYFLRSRSDVNSLDDLYATEASGGMAAYISNRVGISQSAARELHLHMIIYTAGVSFMLISSGNNFREDELVSKLDEAYAAFVLAAKNEEV